MKVTCAISGLRFDCSGFNNLSINHGVGYFHPIFALEYKRLFPLYSKHSAGELTAEDSYLLFLAFLNASGKIEWNHPATCNPRETRTRQLIQNNIAQLIRVIEQTGTIKHPGFSQPMYRVTVFNSHLESLPNFIHAWEDNIRFFNANQATIRARQSLLQIEKRLADLIMAGNPPEKYAGTVAKWASEAADFPIDKRDKWIKIISSCFNINSMFNTALNDIKEVKEYCECNIEAGSLHFHALSRVLKEGISRHVDYLGGSTLALGYEIVANTGGTELENKKAAEKTKQQLKNLAANAPEKPPVRAKFNSTLEYVKAKAAYRLAQNEREAKAIEEAAELKRLELNIASEVQTDTLIKEVTKENHEEEL